MSQAKKGDTVKVHYTGTLTDGTEFDSSEGREPLEFTIGENQVIAGFEKAVIGMSPGETVRIEIKVDDAYGPRNADLVATVSRDQLPEGFKPAIGQQLQLTRDDNSSLIVSIIDISETEVTLDANHPLAGEDLTFSIELVEIAK